jgi:hypothetical protein
MRNVRQKNVKRKEPSLLLSAFAGLLAVIWIGAGIAAAVIPMTGGRWQYIIVAPFAIGYGVIWLVVMLHGRQLERGETIPGLKALFRGDLRHFRLRTH